MSAIAVLTRLTAALRILLAGPVTALVRIRTVVAGFALALLVLLRLLLTQMRLVLLAVFGFSVIGVEIVSHEWILLCGDDPAHEESTRPGRARSDGCAGSANTLRLAEPD